MNTLSPEKLLQHMEVPSRPGIFVLGSFERRVTLYSQQVRALNLIHALLTTKRLKEGQRVAVLGGGAAGLTAAAGAAIRGCSVSLLEQMQTLLPIFKQSRKRLLHPHLYDWPEEGWADECANLPVLDWQAGVARDVARQLLDRWEDVRRNHPLEQYLGVKDLQLLSSTGSPHRLSWYTQQLHDAPFDIVILAVGFGLERTLSGVPHVPYWDDDNLDQPQRDPRQSVRQILVSGTGDGGLVELLRARLEGFQHETLVKDLLSHVPLEETCRALLDIEEQVRNRTLQETNLYERYKQLPVPPAFDEHLQTRLRRDTRAVLNGLEQFPSSDRSSTLNRFLVSRLLWSKDGARYVRGPIQVEPAENGYTVTFQSGRSEHFHQVIVRHGARPALSAENGFAWLTQEDIERLRARNELDQTRYPFWPPGFFEARPPTALSAVPALTLAAAPGTSLPHRLPSKGRTFGREALKRRLMELLLAESPPPVTVLGPPGIGKSTLTVAALHDPEVQRRYGVHRYFIHLDDVTTAVRLNSQLAQALGLPPGPDLPARMAALFGDKPVLLILDNAETPWEADPQETEQLLTELSAIPRLALLLSVRGRVQPTFGSAGSKPIEVPVLELDTARQLFLDIAWNVDPHHPRLDELLEAQEGLALAITLLAHAAQGVDLEWTYVQWQQMRSRLLVRKDLLNRLGSIAVSFELSLQSHRVTAAARRLLSVLSRLPAGVDRSDLQSIFPEDLAAPSVLVQAGLAAFEGQRLRVLAPIREYMQDKHPPSLEDWMRAIAHYSKLAREQGPLVGTEKGGAALKRLADEEPNLGAVLLAELQSTEPRAAIETVLELNNFMRFSGYGSRDALQQALEQARRLGDMNKVAQCTYTLGQLLMRRSQHERARELFQQALPLFEQLKDPRGQARCIHSIGSLALDDMELEKAQQCFQRAIDLRQPLGDRQAIGNCLHGLGKVALSRNQQGEARRYFNEALLVFEEIDNDLGRAYCLRSLGELEADAHQLDRARGLFEKVGYLRGVGHCLRGLADLAHREKQLQHAEALYEEGLGLLRQVGSVRGVANSLLGMGYLALERGDTLAARRAFEQALENYRQVRDEAHEKECLRQLERLAPAP